VIFTPTTLGGAFVIEPEPIPDARGLFARTWCQRELEAHGLESRLAQCSTSFNKRKGTLRGMHYQAAPYREAKLVRCLAGAIYDVIVDLRADSPTRLRSIGVELDASRRAALYVPPGFAHGFLTLRARTEVFYQIGEFYVPEAARGFRWNDPAFTLEWPVAPQVVSERDRTYPDFDLSRFDG
jgi:dTDP-4-dehydrorhamnose 3,5-epimerase